jgi:hypothetical protein
MTRQSLSPPHTHTSRTRPATNPGFSKNHPSSENSSRRRTMFRVLVSISPAALLVLLLASTRTRHVRFDLFGPIPKPPPLPSLPASLPSAFAAFAAAASAAITSNPAPMAIAAISRYAAENPPPRPPRPPQPHHPLSPPSRRPGVSRPQAHPWARPCKFGDTHRPSSSPSRDSPRLPRPPCFPSPSPTPPPLLGLAGSATLHLVGLPVVVLVLLQAVPLYLTPRAIARRLIRAGG